MAALAGLQQAVQQEGGIDALLGKLKDGGLGQQVDSWVGTGGNQPVDPAALGQALGPDTVQRLSSGSGIDIGQLLPLLATFLPQIIDMLTPNGTVPAGGLRPGRERHGPRRRARRPPRRRRRAGGPAAARTSAGCSAASSAATSADRRGRASSPGHRRTSMPDTTAVRGRRQGLTASSGHGVLARRHPHPALPRGGGGRLAVHRPTRRDAPTSSRSGSGGTGRRSWCFSKPDAVKIRNLRAGSSVMLGVGDADEDFDIGLFQGRAEILDVPTAEILPAGHLEKYASQMAGIGLTPAEYAETYPLAVRITPSHYLGWHGRSVPQSVRVAGAPRTTIDEPAIGRPSLREWLGEPLARGLRGFGVGLLRPGAAGAL